MRVNVYAEEMTQRVEIVTKRIGTEVFTGLRLYLELPVTVRRPTPDGHNLNTVDQVSGPFIHNDVNGIQDDDSSAVTFWGKRDLRHVVHLMHAKLDEHYRGHNEEPNTMGEEHRSTWLTCANQLERHNPRMWASHCTGQDSALNEIKRLQECERELKLLKKGASTT